MDTEEPAKVNYALEQIRQLYTVETMCDDAYLTYEERAAEVDPHQWLTDVLTKIPYYNQDYSKDLAELLPHNWKVSNSRTES